MFPKRVAHRTLKISETLRKRTSTIMLIGLRFSVTGEAKRIERNKFKKEERKKVRNVKVWFN